MRDYPSWKCQPLIGPILLPKNLLTCDVAILDTASSDKRQFPEILVTKTWASNALLTATMTSTTFTHVEKGNSQTSF